MRPRIARWRSRRGVDGGAAATPARVVAVEAADRRLALVLGMAWHTVLGVDLGTQARRRARALGATHWAHAGGRAESVGTTRLSRASLQGSRQAHAAALVFAGLAPTGVHALACRLPDDAVWLAIVHDGHVIAHGDTVHGSAEDAALALAANEARFGAALCVHGDAAALLTGRPIEDRGLDLATLASHAGPASVLHSRTRAGAGWARPALALALSVAAVFAVQHAWHARRALAPAPPVAAAAEAASEAADAAGAWKLAEAAFARDVVLPGVDGLAALWHGIGALPLRPAGWLLRDGDCVLAGAGWRCDASYERVGRVASARDLDRHLAAPGRVLRWPTLERATVAFVVPLPQPPAAALDRLVGVPAPVGLIEEADALHVLRPLFRHVEVGAPVPVAVPAPRDAQGRPLAPPAAEAGLVQRPLHLHGPLRSLTLVGPELTERIAWHRLAFSIDPAATAATADSAVMATLHGVRYARP